MNLEIVQEHEKIWSIRIQGKRVGSIIKKSNHYETKFKLALGNITTENIPSFEEAKKTLEGQVKELVELLSSSYTDEDVMEVIEKRLAEIPIKDGK